MDSRSKGSRVGEEMVLCESFSLTEGSLTDFRDQIMRVVCDRGRDQDSCEFLRFFASALVLI